MAIVFAIIVSVALGLLTFAIVDKFVGLFMDSFLKWAVSFAIGAAIVWIGGDWWTPLLVEAFGG